MEEPNGADMTIEEIEFVDAVKKLTITYIKNTELRHAHAVLSSCMSILNIIEEDSKELK